MKTMLRLFVTFGALFCTELFAGNLKVNLAPAQAVTAGAQWRVDGGSWRNSGTTVKNLSNTTHTVAFKTVTGWITPAPVTVTITRSNTTTLNTTYVQAAALTINLTPASGQWRVDGGAWRATGTTATGLTPSSHLVEYAGVTGYNSPASENVSLPAGQTTTLARSYVQLAQLSVTLTPASGQWSVNGGAWQASGATIANLTPGSHSIDYSSLANYSSPVAESVSLAAGQSLSLARNYIQLAQISINLTPASGQWRANGGAWQTAGTTLSVLPGDHLIEYAGLADYDAPANETITLAAGGTFTATRNYTSQKPTLLINLAPNSGQWRIDGGAWQASGAQVTGLTVGSHSIEYTDIGGIYNPLPSETISLALRENATLTRSYPIKPPASLTITLDPTTAQWRVDNGDWQASGTTLANLAYGVPHTVDYDSVIGYLAPGSETFTPASGQLVSLSRTYTQLANFSVTLDPPYDAQWRIDGGAWQSSGSTLFYLALGTHTVEFSPVEGYITPTSETITLVSGPNTPLDRSYVQLASLYVQLYTPNAQWRIDGGTWNGGAIVLNNLSLGAHLIEYSDAIGYVTPASESITLVSGANTHIAPTYVQLASLYVQLSTPNAQWRIDGGAWNDSAIVLNYLNLGLHLIEYSDVIGYITPASESITLVSGANTHIAPTYSLIGAGVGQLTVTLTPAAAQWRIDGGTWQASGATVTGLASGSHLLEFSSLAGYRQPPSELVNIFGTSVAISRTYPAGVPAEYSAVDVGTLGSGQTFTYGLNEFGTVTGTSWVGTSGIPHAFISTNGIITDLDAAGGTQTVPAALNDANMVVGFGTYGQVRAVLISGGTVLNLGTFGGNLSEATDINQAGIVVGSATAANGKKHAFVRPLDTLLDLGTLGGTESEASAINDSDVIVGTFRAADSSQHGFRYANGTMQDLGTFGGTSIYRIGLSESGTVYVSVFTGSGLRSFTWNNGVTTDLGTLGGAITAAFAINASDVIVGGSDFADGQRRAIYYSGGSLYALPSLGTDGESQATAINDAGTIIGWSLPPAGTSRAVVYRGGAITDLNAIIDLPETLLSWPVAINQVGQILVEGTQASSGLNHAYVLTPTNGPGGLQISLDQPGAQWRVDGGAWQASGAKLFNLAAGGHTIEYSAVAGHTSPPTETVTVSSGRLLQLNRSYTVVP